MSTVKDKNTKLDWYEDIFQVNYKGVEWRRDYKGITKPSVCEVLHTTLPYWQYITLCKEHYKTLAQIHAIVITKHISNVITDNIRSCIADELRDKEAERRGCTSYEIYHYPLHGMVDSLYPIHTTSHGTLCIQDLNIIREVSKVAFNQKHWGSDVYHIGMAVDYFENLRKRLIRRYL